MGKEKKKKQKQVVSYDEWKQKFNSSINKVIFGMPTTVKEEEPVILDITYETAPTPEPEPVSTPDPKPTPEAPIASQPTTATAKIKEAVREGAQTGEIKTQVLPRPLIPIAEVVEKGGDIKLPPQQKLTKKEKKELRKEAKSTPILPGPVAEPPGSYQAAPYTPEMVVLGASVGGRNSANELFDKLGNPLFVNRKPVKFDPATNEVMVWVPQPAPQQA